MKALLSAVVPLLSSPIARRKNKKQKKKQCWARTHIDLGGAGVHTVRDEIAKARLSVKEFERRIVLGAGKQIPS